MDSLPPQGLPLEIWTYIALCCDRTDLKDLCSLGQTCKALFIIIEPMLYFDMPLDGSSGRRNDRSMQLLISTLVKRRDLLDHARALWLFSIDESTEAAVKDLPLVLAGLRKVRSVYLERSSLSITILDLLRRCPVNHLEIRESYNAEILPEPLHDFLPHLKSLKLSFESIRQTSKRGWLKLLGLPVRAVELSSVVLLFAEFVFTLHGERLLPDTENLFISLGAVADINLLVKALEACKTLKPLSIDGPVTGTTTAHMVTQDISSTAIPDLVASHGGPKLAAWACLDVQVEDLQLYARDNPVNLIDIAPTLSSVTSLTIYDITWTNDFVQDATRYRPRVEFVVVRASQRFGTMASNNFRNWILGRILSDSQPLKYWETLVLIPQVIEPFRESSEDTDLCSIPIQQFQALLDGIRTVHPRVKEVRFNWIN